MSKIVMTQALCAAGYEPLAKEGPIYVANNGNPSEYPEEMKDAECIIVRIGHMNCAEIEAAPKLRVIGRSGIGYDSIDIAAANEYGIPVVIAPPLQRRFCGGAHPRPDVCPGLQHRGVPQRGRKRQL